MSIFTSLAKSIGSRVAIVISIAFIAGVAFTLLRIENLKRELATARIELSIANETIVVKDAVIAQLQIVANREIEVKRIVDHVVEQIEASPNAETLVPPDIARLWGDGIDRLRNKATTGGGEHSGDVAELPAS